MKKFRDTAVNKEKSITTYLYETAENVGHYMWILAVAAIVICIAVALALTRYLLNQLGTDPFFAKGIAMEIAKGNLQRDITINSGDKTSLLFHMKEMQQQLLIRLNKERQERDEAIRLKTALDNISSNVMVANNEGNIIYVNPSALAMLKNAEEDIKKSLPKFEIGKVIGSNMDIFHKNPSRQQKLLAELTKEYRNEIFIGSRTFYLVANPITNTHRQRIGSVVEWKDRTSEVAIEQEVARVVSGAVMGDFTQRILEENKDGFYLQLAQGVNELMETSSKGLNEVVVILEALAKGDLTQSITTNYSGTFARLKNDTNSTVDKLKEVVGLIKDASEAINTAAKEIAAGNNDLSHRTEEQAASLEETAASMEELTSTVQANSEHASHASRLAVGATDIAGKGVQVVGKVVATMEDIHESSRKIVDIISVIDSIAFQTNILALNAAVEAARAGEQGRGFAVVAVEVRNLAQRAAAAAAEIKGLIGDSVEKIEDGSKLVGQAGKTMEEIVTAIRGVTSIMTEISSASMEQTSGIQQVNQAISQMDDVTQQNAALVEEAAAAAESLEEQTQSLAVTVSHFKLNYVPQSSGIAKFEPKKAISSAKPVTSTVKRIEAAPESPAIGIVDFNLDKALEKHAEWKVKFRTAISKREEMDAATISKDDCCEFGKWLHGEAKPLVGHFDSFDNCEKKHAEFHIEAGKVAEIINAKQFATAEKMLDTGSPFINASTAVGVAITRLRKDVHSPTPASFSNSNKDKIQVAAKSDDEWEEF